MRVVWLGALLIGVSLPVLALEDQDRGSGVVPGARPKRENDGTLREAGSVASLIERLDAARRSGEVLPVHAVDLSLRKAVERELNGGDPDPGRQRALRLQGAERVDADADDTRRDEAYRTPVASWVDARDAPPPGPRKAAKAHHSAVDEADFERRLRAVVHELSRLDGVLDEAGLNARRDLLVQLLQVARDREQSRVLRDAVAD